MEDSLSAQLAWEREIDYQRPKRVCRDCRYGVMYSRDMGVERYCEHPSVPAALHGFGVMGGARCKLWEGGK